MEDDQKKTEAAKMISTSTTDPQKEEPSQTQTSFNNIKEVAGDIPMYDSSNFPLESSPTITPKKRKEGPETDTSSAESPTKVKRRRRSPPGSGSGSKKRKQGPSPTISSGSSETTSSQTEGSSETTSGATPTKKRPPCPPGKLTPGLIDLNAGQDMIDIICSICQAFPHRMFSIISVIGTISEVGLFTPSGLAHQKGEFEILSLSVRSLVGDNGRHCRAKAKCSVSWIDNKGIMYASASVNSLIAAGPAKIITAYFNKDNAKKAGARILGHAAAAAARKGYSDSKMLVEGQTSYHSPKLKILPIRRVVDRKVFPIEATPLQMIEAISDPAKEYCAKVIEEAGSGL
ncbi:uncharacterized protein LOC127086580 [Lathyrus oleraceus]|uniref:AT-hook motif nuclear-localized protein n=1 Tax=Pisum sativum TaxID=3888 RepID=A0A9D5AM48_PEA|nr:uncharacterized protein LOC127086580 [Pisum sativum]KAI5412371.1 hypothetical protein KIW84_057153 [Pisum sativum]